MPTKFVILAILDGWGLAAPGAGNAISQANTVNMNRFWASYPHTQLGASGEAVGFSNLPLLKGLSEKKCATMKYPSFIYGGIQVANGKYIGAAFYHKWGHDAAALKIITEEAGGKVTDLNGEERRWDQDGLGCLVSNGILHKELLDIVQMGKL